MSFNTNNPEKTRILNLSAAMYSEKDLDTVTENGSKMDMSLISDDSLMYVIAEAVKSIMLLDSTAESIIAFGYYAALHQIMTEKNSFDINSDVERLDTLAEEKAINFAKRLNVPNAEKVIAKSNDFDMHEKIADYWIKSQIESKINFYNRSNTEIKNLAQKFSESNFSGDCVQTIIEENHQIVDRLCVNFNNHFWDSSESFAETFSEFLKDMSVEAGLNAEYARPSLR